MESNTKNFNYSNTQISNIDNKAQRLKDILTDISSDYKLINIEDDYYNDKKNNVKFSIDIHEAQSKFNNIYEELIKLADNFNNDKNELLRNIELRNFKNKQDELNRKNKEEQEKKDLEKQNKKNNIYRLLGSTSMIVINFLIMNHITIYNRIPLSIIDSLLCITGIVLGVKAIGIKYKKICVSLMIINILLLIFNIYLCTVHLS